MSSVQLYLRNSDTNETVGAITDVDLETTLAEIRQKTIFFAKSSHVDYRFVVCGTSINQKQEKKYRVAQCVTKLDQPQTYLCDVKITEVARSSSDSTKPTSETLTEASAASKKRERDSVTWCQEGHSAIGKKDSEKQKYVIIYGDDEINNALRLFEKERMIFANKKVKEISNDAFFDTWGFQEICGLIDVHWTLKKTELLNSYVKELEISNLTMGMEKASQVNLTSVLKNSDKLNEAQFLTDKGYKKFCEEISRNDGEKRRGELENQFDAVFSVLKSAQCNLIRSIEQYKRTGIGDQYPKEQ
jgi:hypothetical protein